MNSENAPQIVCLGEPMVEFNEQPDGQFLTGFGGDTSNCAVAAARQGARAGYLTRLGRDTFGDRIVAMWTRENVDHSFVLRDDGAPTGIYFVTHHADGHRFSYYRSGSAASRMRPGDLSEACISEARILHVSAISQAISESAAETVAHAIDVARASGTLVSYDTNLRLNLWSLDAARAVVDQTIPKSDIVLPGLEDAVALTGRTTPDAIADAYLEAGTGTVAVTLGPDGTFIATQDRRELVTGHRVSSVDATGAGDTFDGAYLAELAAGRDPFEAARYANAAAALSTCGYGAVAPIPYRKDVEAFLGSRRA